VLSLVSIAPFHCLPFSFYAGHQFQYHFLAGLARDYDVHAIAPDEGNSLPSIPDLPFSVHLAPPFEPDDSPLERYLAFKGVPSLARRTTIPALEGPASRLIATADAICLSWAQTLALAPLIRAQRSDAVLLAVEYDVLFRTVRPVEPSRDRSRDRVKRLAQRLRIRRGEVTGLNLCDFYVAFKEADIAACRAAGVTTPGLLASPYLETPPADAPLDRADGRTVIFVGAFDRPENSEGALWLIRHVWPRVSKHLSDCVLVLAGAHPTPDMLAAQSRLIQVTGPVSDLYPSYCRASCALAPIFQGGGLRFKVPQALRYGLPVVATPRALEGLEALPLGLLPPATTDPDRFAKNIVDVLTHPRTWASRAKEAQRWCTETFSFERTLEDIRRELARRLVAT
jgi:glycosyltransferase involved in cell wall biosynthesis